MHTLYDMSDLCISWFKKWMKLLVISSMFLCLKQRKRNHYHAGPQSPLSSRMLSGCAMFGDDDCKLPMLKVASNESFYFLFYFLLKSFY